MIKFNDLNQETPYQLLKEKYDEAVDAGQKVIEAISISSFNKQIHEVDSRYVNLKFIADDEFIFFSNYDSSKASSFNSHNQIAALLYWPSINVQIRMKAKIKRMTDEFNQNYFFGLVLMLRLELKQTLKKLQMNLIKNIFFKDLKKKMH